MINCIQNLMERGELNSKMGSLSTPSERCHTWQ